MDGFEIRLQLVSILKKLTSSQNSIQSTIRFLLKHKKKYGEDLWDCLIEEAEKVNLNARINILYLIDGLLFTCSTSLLTSDSTRDYNGMKLIRKKEEEEGEGDDNNNKKKRKINSDNKNLNNEEINYGYLIKKDILKLIEIVIPIPNNNNNNNNDKNNNNGNNNINSKKGLLNLMSTQQVVKNWKSQIHLIDQFLDLDDFLKIDQLLINRKSILAQAQVDSIGLDDDSLDFSKKDILGRIDDDRERHKRLRERIWALPIPPISSISGKLINPMHPATTYAIHRSTTLLHTSLLKSSSHPIVQQLSSSADKNRQQQQQQQTPPHLQSDLTISLECDQLILANLEDTAGLGLEESDWIAIKFENQRCFALPPNPIHFNNNDY